MLGWIKRTLLFRQVFGTLGFFYCCIIFNWFKSLVGVDTLDVYISMGLHGMGMYGIELGFALGMAGWDTRILRDWVCLGMVGFALTIGISFWE